MNRLTEITNEITALTATLTAENVIEITAQIMALAETQQRIKNAERFTQMQTDADLGMIAEINLRGEED